MPEQNHALFSYLFIILLLAYICPNSFRSMLIRWKKSLSFLFEGSRFFVCRFTKAKYKAFSPFFYSSFVFLSFFYLLNWFDFYTIFCCWLIFDRRLLSTQYEMEVCTKKNCVWPYVSTVRILLSIVSIKSAFMHACISWELQE